MKLLLTLLALSLPAFSATTVGPSGEGITSGTRSAFLTALGGTTAGKALFAIGNGANGYILQSNGSGGVSWVAATGGSDLTSGPVTSTAGVSTIADAALTIAKTSGLQTALDAKAPLVSPSFTSPSLAHATATSINKIQITGPSIEGALIFSSNYASITFPAVTGTLASIADIGTAALPAANLTGTVNLARLVNTQTVDGTAAGPTTITAGTRDVIVSPGVSGAKTFILPGATTALGYPAGARLTFTDMLNSLSSSNTATLQPASGGYINNVLNGTMVLTTAGASPMLISDGSGRWNMDIRGVARGGTGVTISGTTSQIAVGGGTSSPIVWTTATGTGAPLRGTSPTITTGITFAGGASLTESGGGVTITNTSSSKLTVNGQSAGQESISASRLIYAGEGIRIGNGGKLYFSDGADYAQEMFLTGDVFTFNRGLSATSLAVTGTSTLTGGLVLPTSTTPASASASGVTGTVCWDASFIYVCTATNTWKRVAIATW